MLRRHDLTRLKEFALRVLAGAPATAWRRRRLHHSHRRPDRRHRPSPVTLPVDAFPTPTGRRARAPAAADLGVLAPGRRTTLADAARETSVVASPGDGWDDRRTLEARFWLCIPASLNTRSGFRPAGLRTVRAACVGEARSPRIGTRTERARAQRSSSSPRLRWCARYAASANSPCQDAWPRRIRETDVRLLTF